MRLYYKGPNKRELKEALVGVFADVTKVNKRKLNKDKWERAVNRVFVP